MSSVTVVAGADVAGPAERAFQVLTDWERHGEWMPLTRAEGGHEVGAALSGRTGIGRVGFLDTMIITAWEPGRRVEVDHTGRVVRGKGWFEVRPLTEGHCRITWGERLDLPLGLFGRVGWLVLGPMVKAFMSLGLRRLARLVK